MKPVVVLNCISAVFVSQKCFNFFCRFQDENNKEDKVEKWTTPTIHNLYKIFEDLNIDAILESECDKRKSRIQELSVPQLKHECTARNINNQGKKVHIFIYIKQYLYITG